MAAEGGERVMDEELCLSDNIPARIYSSCKGDWIIHVQIQKKGTGRTSFNSSVKLLNPRISSTDILFPGVWVTAMAAGVKRVVERHRFVESSRINGSAGVWKWQFNIPPFGTLGGDIV